VTKSTSLSYSASVLVVEDDAFLRELIGAAVDHLGFHPMLAGNLAEALILAKDEPPDVIVTDLFEGRISSLDLTPVRRLLGTWPDAPIILCTARLGAEHLDPSEHGLHAVILKPFDLDHFLNTVHQAAAGARRIIDATA
jgi:CheY-like chemotaxis protein